MSSNLKIVKIKPVKSVKIVDYFPNRDIMAIWKTGIYCFAFWGRNKKIKSPSRAQRMSVLNPVNRAEKMIAPLYAPSPIYEIFQFYQVYQLVPGIVCIYVLYPSYIDHYLQTYKYHRDRRIFYVYQKYKA